MDTPSDPPETTCWTLIEGAAKGSVTARNEFAARYRRVVEAYLTSRWRSGRAAQEIPDAVQEVFFECFKEAGALERARRGGGHRFRGYLFGITRNVAARFEERGLRQPRSEPDEELASTGEEPDEVFEKEMALTLMDQARQRMAARARILGGEAGRRIEVLRLRFEEGLPVRDIAGRLGLEAAFIQKQYARAREEFHDTLREVVAGHVIGGREEIDAECRHLLAVLKTATP